MWLIRSQQAVTWSWNKVAENSSSLSSSLSHTGVSFFTREDWTQGLAILQLMSSWWCWFPTSARVVCKWLTSFQGGNENLQVRGHTSHPEWREIDSFRLGMKCPKRRFEYLVMFMCGAADWKTDWWSICAENNGVPVCWGEKTSKPKGFTNHYSCPHPWIQAVSTNWKNKFMNIIIRY